MAKLISMLLVFLSVLFLAFKRLSFGLKPIFLLIFFNLFCAIAIAQELQNSLILNPKPNPIGDVYELDEKTVDFFIPVITMEQIYSPQTRRQGYRIKIFKDGRGIYHGLRDVKILGEVDFKMNEEAVKKILAEFNEFKFWSIAENQYGLPRGFGVMPLEFILRINDQTKTVRFGGQRHAVALQHTIEKYVDSQKWRCPFVDEDGRNPCERRQREIAEDFPIFLERDLPKLKDMYK